MPEDVQTYAARVAAAASTDGRLAIDPHGAVERFVADLGGRAVRG